MQNFVKNRKKERENIECHELTSFWVAPRMATLCITAAHRRWVKFRGSKRRAKTFASSLVKHSGRLDKICDNGQKTQQEMNLSAKVLFRLGSTHSDPCHLEMKSSFCCS